MRTKTVVSAIALCSALLILGGCVIYTPHFKIEGRAREKEYTVDSYNSVVLSGPFELVYSNTPSDKVTVEAYENLFRHLTVETRGDTLYLRAERAFVFSAIPTRVYISAETLKSLTVEGAVVFKNADAIEADDFSLYIEGACAVDLSVNAKSLSVYCAGAESLYLRGSAETFELRSDGAGSVDAYHLETKDAHVTINGVGDVSLNCTEYLNAEINGVGSLKYRGDPVVTRNIAGIGVVKAE